MKVTNALRAAVVLLVTLMSACATTDTTSTTWTDPNAPGYGYPYPPPPPGYVRGGQVQSVQEVVQRTQGQPAAGAVAGALIGSFLFGGYGPGSALAGAAGGAAVGAAASSGSSEARTYHVVVRFDDGGFGTFVYAGYSPFGPGERVVLTSQGLAHG